MTEFLSLIHHYKICIWEMSVSYFDCTNYYFDIGRSDMGLLIHKRRCFTRTAFVFHTASYESDVFYFTLFLLKNVTTAIPPAARRTVRYPAIFALSPVTTAVLPTFPPFPPGVGFGCVLGTRPL